MKAVSLAFFTEQNNRDLDQVAITNLHIKQCINNSNNNFKKKDNEIVNSTIITLKDITAVHIERNNNYNNNISCRLTTITTIIAV